jgi:hypothetical protein
MPGRFAREKPGFRRAEEQRQLRLARAAAIVFTVNFSSLAVVHSRDDSVLALRIVFSICLAIVLAAGAYIFRIRKRLFDRDPEVVADHWAARNLRLWQVVLVWLLAVELLVSMLWRL